MSTLHKTSLLTATLAFAFLIPTSAQDAEHEEHHPKGEESTSPAPGQPPAPSEGPGPDARPRGDVPPGMMAEKCSIMAGKMAAVKEMMASMDQALDEKIRLMNESEGSEKIAAMESVIAELVSQRRHIHDMNERMHGDMMAHVREHMMAEMGRGRGPDEGRGPGPGFGPGLGEGPGQGAGPGQGKGMGKMMECPMMQPKPAAPSQDHEAHH